MAGKNLDSILTEMERLADKSEALLKENEELKEKVEKLEKEKARLSKKQKDVKNDKGGSSENADINADSGQSVMTLDDTVSVYKLTLELETCRQLLEAKEARIRQYEEENSSRRIEEAANTSNARTYEALYNKKLEECTKLMKENEAMAAKMAALKNLNEAYKNELSLLHKHMALKEKENDALLKSNMTVSTDKVNPAIAAYAKRLSKAFDGASPKPRTASTYDLWKEAYESGITSEKEMLEKNICSSRTHFRNLQKYRNEKKKKR